MSKLLSRATCICVIFSTAGAASDTSETVQVSVMHSGWVSCGKSSGIKMTLQVEVRNLTKEPLVLGGVHVAQERFYRKDEKGKLELLETTSVPDEFVPSDATAYPSDIYAGIQEQSLLQNTTRSFEIVHNVYVSSAVFRLDGETAKTLVSFHVTNVRRDGPSEYWSPGSPHSSAGLWGA